MANTYELIASYSATGTVSSIDFTSIPSTYTDLVLKVSALGNTTEGMYLQFNGSTANFSGRYLIGDGSSALSGSLARYAGSIMLVTNTPNNTEIYIPNYAGSSYKSYSVDNAQEANATTAYVNLIAGLWSSTSAITSIKIEAANSFKQYSTAYLYGVKNA